MQFKEDSQALMLKKQTPWFEPPRDSISPNPLNMQKIGLIRGDYFVGRIKEQTARGHDVCRKFRAAE